MFLLIKRHFPAGVIWCRENMLFQILWTFTGEQVDSARRTCGDAFITSADVVAGIGVTGTCFTGNPLGDIHQHLPIAAAPGQSIQGHRQVLECKSLIDHRFNLSLGVHLVEGFLSF